jgi:ribose transport system substrate-binding protein
MKKFLLVLLAGLLFVSMVSAGGQKSRSSGAKKYTIGVVYSIVHPFFDPCTEGFNEKAAEFGVDVLIDAPQTGAVADQIRILENYLSQGVDALAICPTESKSIIPIVEQARAKNIPVLVFGVEAPDIQNITYVGTNQRKFAEDAADLLGELIDGKGDIVISQGLSTQLDQQQRVDYFVQRINSRYPAIKILDVQTGGGNTERTLANVENMLQANPTVVGLYGTDAAAGPAVQTAFKNINRNVKVVVGDTLPEIILGVREGSITKTLAQRPKEWAIQSMNVLYGMLTGSLTNIPETVDTGTFVLDKTNVDKYFDANGNQIAELK